MKKAKIISIVIIMLSVVALGVFMGKQMFKLMEAGTVSQPATTVDADGSSVHILYTSDGSDNPDIDAIEATRVSNSEPEEAPIELIEAPASDGDANVAFSKEGPTWHAYANQNGINVRTGPGTNHDQLFKVAQGTRGSVVDKKDGWTQIHWDFNRKTGWVRDDLLIQGPAAIMTTLMNRAGGVENIDIQQVSEAAAKLALKENKIAVAIAEPAPVETTVTALVTSENLPSQATIKADPMANIRSAPGTQHERVGRLPKGLVVQIKNVQQLDRWQWFEIIFNEGRNTGWTREDNLSF